MSNKIQIRMFDKNTGQDIYCEKTLEEILESPQGIYMDELHVALLEAIRNAK